MNLIIDAGNSFVKIAVFSKGLLFCKERIANNELFKIKELLKIYPTISHAIICSVSNVKLKEVSSYLGNIKVFELNKDTPIPFKVNYDTPETLGVDRIALAAAAHAKYGDRNCLVIDAGSCVTYEFLDKEGVYQGGIISPGLTMRYKSLHEFTARLPLLSPKNEKSIVGKSTSSAMHNGTFRAMSIEINGIIEQFSNTYDHLVVIVTGGDAHFLSKRLKNGIFAHSNFLMQGLNYILEYNIDR